MPLKHQVTAEDFFSFYELTNISSLNDLQKTTQYIQLEALTQWDKNEYFVLIKDKHYESSYRPLVKEIQNHKGYKTYFSKKPINDIAEEYLKNANTFKNADFSQHHIYPYPEYSK